MMLYLNGLALLPLSTLALLASVFHYDIPVSDYFLTHSDKFSLVLLFGLISAIGQVFIFRAIVTFGALTLAVITTTRKFFTVFLSILVFKHTLSMGQWMCVALVLIGSTLDAASRYIIPKEKS